MNYTKLSIPLSEQEQRALKMAASKACRRPRDHVRFIVLSALGVIEPSAEMSKPAIANAKIESQPVVNVSLGQNKSVEQTVAGSGAFVGAN